MCAFCSSTRRLAGRAIMFSDCPFVRLSVRSFVCYQTCEHNILKTKMNWFRCDLAHIVYAARTWNFPLCQRSWSYKAEGICGGTFSTSLCRESFLVLSLSHRFFFRFWYLRCCGCPWNRGRQHLAMPQNCRLLYCVPYLCMVMCKLVWAVLTEGCWFNLCFLLFFLDKGQLFVLFCIFVYFVLSLQWNRTHSKTIFKKY